MATVTRKSGKKTAAKKSEPAKEAPARRAKFAPTAAEVKAIAEQLRGGAKMNDIKAELGLNNGQPIRNALREHGFDSKGNKNPEGLSARELQAQRRAGEGDAPKSSAKKSSAKATTRKRATKAKVDPSDQD